MKNTFFITAVAALIILGVAALLWILGVWSVAQMQASTAKAIGVVFVVAVVALGIAALAGQNKHLPPTPKM